MKIFSTNCILKQERFWNVYFLKILSPYVTILKILHTLGLPFTENYMMITDASSEREGSFLGWPPKAVSRGPKSASWKVSTNWPVVQGVSKDAGLLGPSVVRDCVGCSRPSGSHLQQCLWDQPGPATGKALHLNLCALSLAQQKKY